MISDHSKQLNREKVVEFSEIPYTIEYITSEDRDAVLRMQARSPEFINNKGWISGKYDKF